MYLINSQIVLFISIFHKDETPFSGIDKAEMNVSNTIIEKIYI